MSAQSLADVVAAVAPNFGVRADQVVFKHSTTMPFGIRELRHSPLLCELNFNGELLNQTPLVLAQATPESVLMEGIVAHELAHCVFGFSTHKGSNLDRRSAEVLADLTALRYVKTFHEMQYPHFRDDLLKVRSTFYNDPRYQYAQTLQKLTAVLDRESSSTFGRQAVLNVAKASQFPADEVLAAQLAARQ